MGKGNKNSKKNAYYFFMEEFRTIPGNRKMSLSEAAAHASPHWQKLTVQQRQKYENMARATKENQFKQTSIGESVDLVLQEEKEKRDREVQLKQEIENIIRKGINTETIADQYFYLMHVNDYCYYEQESRYYPAEIALGKFNLRNGIMKEDVFHSLVQPGPLPMGYAAIVKMKSDETHQLQHVRTENNIEAVFMGVVQKLSEDTENDEFPPIYVSEKDVLLIENVLEHMCADLGQGFTFKLYSLQYLLFALKNNIASTAHQSKVWPTISVSKLQLEKDVYDFCSGISCAYHENAEMPIYCSQSQVIRWAYIICDNCIKDLDIRIIPGKHVPLNALTYPQLVATASGSSKKSKASDAPTVASSTSKYHSEIASDASTVVDGSEVSSYHGFDSDSQAAEDEEEEWHLPRRAMKQRTKNLSQQSHPSENNSQLSQNSSNAEYIPARRPISQSAVVPGLARLNISNNMCGRGRGRGIMQTRPPM